MLRPSASGLAQSQSSVAGRPRQLAREALLLGSLLLIVLLATLTGVIYARPAAIAPDTDLDDVFSGFYDLEHNELFAYRWTTGRGEVCSDSLGHVPAGALRLALPGGTPLQLGVDRVRILANGQLLADAALQPGMRHYHLLFNSQHQRDYRLCLTLESATAQAAGDPRQLGLVFQELSLQRLSAASLPLPAPVTLLVNLGLAAIGYTTLRRLGLSARLGWLLLVLLTLLLSAALLSGVLTTGLGLTRNLLPLLGGLLLVNIGSWALLPTLQRWGQRLAAGRHALPGELPAMAVLAALLLSGVWMLQLASGHHGVWPLKAGVAPAFAPALLGIVPLFALWLALVLWLLARPAARPALALTLLIAGAILLPVMLKVLVRGWESLFYTFTQNPTEYILDVPRVDDPLAFLGRYVEISPDLAWHNANHPPGSVLLLWAIAQLLGPGPVIATWAVIVLGALGAVAAYWLGTRLGDWRLGLLASAIYVAMPGHQVYSVTSMDIIFNSSIALAGVALFLALQPGARPALALLAGSLAALGLFFTYAATQLTFFGLALVLLQLRREPARLAHIARQAVLAGGTLLAIYGLVYLVSGFNIIAGAMQATANNARVLGRSLSAQELSVLAPPTLTSYVHFLGVNIVPYAWYLAPWGLAALLPQLADGLRQWRRPQTMHILALGLAGWVLGMWLNGLFIREVERIWGFTYPLAAVLIASYAWQGPDLRQRLWRAGFFISLFFAQSAVMRAWLNLYW